MSCPRFLYWLLSVVCTSRCLGIGLISSPSISHFEWPIGIPKTIHFCYKHEGIPSFVKDTWRALNPDFTIKVHGDAACHAFLLAHFGGEIAGCNEGPAGIEHTAPTVRTVYARHGARTDRTGPRFAPSLRAVYARVPHGPIRACIWRIFCKPSRTDALARATNAYSGEHAGARTLHGSTT